MTEISLTDAETRYCNNVHISNEIPESLLKKVYQAHHLLYSQETVGGGHVKPYSKWHKDLNGGFIYIYQHKNILHGYTATMKLIEKFGHAWAKKAGTAGLKKGVGTQLVKALTDYLTYRNIIVFSEVTYDRMDLRAIYLKKCGFRPINDREVIPIFFKEILNKDAKLKWIGNKFAIYSRHTGFMGWMPPKILVMKLGKMHSFMKPVDFLKKIFKMG